MTQIPASTSGAGKLYLTHPIDTRATCDLAARHPRDKVDPHQEQMQDTYSAITFIRFFWYPKIQRQQLTYNQN